MLAVHDWGMVITPGPDHQKLVTLYNRKTLAIDLARDTQGLFKSVKSDKFRGFQANFIHLLTKKPLALVNLHLEFGKDYHDEILHLQKQFISQDMTCIMGGDVNSVQNGLSTMIGDAYAATNISADGHGGFTTAHELQQTPGEFPLQKTYDGFFVNPGQTTYAIIKRTGGMRFNDLGNGRVEYAIYTASEERACHWGLTGEPWERIENLIARLQQERTLARDDATLNLLEKKLRCILPPEPTELRRPQPYPFEGSPHNRPREYLPPVPNGYPSFSFAPYGYPHVPHGYMPLGPYGYPPGPYGYFPPEFYGHPPGPYRSYPPLQCPPPVPPHGAPIEAYHGYEPALPQDQPDELFATRLTRAEPSPSKRFNFYPPSPDKAEDATVSSYPTYTKNY